jgi:opacity protein-like surface antigen
MKKVILTITALVMVASGVAAVSAYEAHVINVKAKVENALLISYEDTNDLQGPLTVDFGTVFPEEWLSKHFSIGFSTSFAEASTRVDTVDWEIWAEKKELDPAVPTYYPWLGEAMYIKLDSQTGYVGGAPVSPAMAVPVKDYTVSPAVHLTGNITNSAMPGGVSSRTVYIWLDVPVYFDFYNPDTDVPNKPRADWADEQLAAYLGPPNTATSVQGTPSKVLPTGTVQGYTMGVDLKVQVVGIYKWVAPGP